MASQGSPEAYTSLAQRVADSYVRSLSGLGDSNGQPQGTADLHGFFADWYRSMAGSPDAYGLPITEDICIEDDKPDGSEKKQQVGSRVKRLRETIGHGLGFLYLAGLRGRLEVEALVLDKAIFAEFLAKQPKVKKQVLRGMTLAGLEVADSGAAISITNIRYPRMMHALQVLAQGCSRQQEESDALFCFSRCDLRAQAPDYHPDPTDLYRVFPPADQARVMALHEYLISKRYRTTFQNNSLHGWEVLYQGDRKIKSSPLLHVEYSVRFRNPLRLRLKCASADRIVPLVEQQGHVLQDDFFRRVNYCRGEDCGWCKSKKALGPSVLTYQGSQHVICWYTNPDMRLEDDAAVELVKEYEAMHQMLAQG